VAAKKRSGVKTAEKDFAGAFEGLRGILQPYAAKLHAKHDTADSYYLEAYDPDSHGKLFFAAAKINKNYVSFHLMAAYCFPELLRGISLELRTHMQGKACFNFAAPDARLFGELKALTTSGARMFRSLETA
jgi:hypothetical protein